MPKITLKTLVGDLSDNDLLRALEYFGGLTSEKCPSNAVRLLAKASTAAGLRSFGHEEIDSSFREDLKEHLDGKMSRLKFLIKRAKEEVPWYPWD